MQLELIDQARRALTRCGARPLLSGPLAVPLFKAFAQPLQNAVTNRWTLFQTEITGDAPWELRSISCNANLTGQLGSRIQIQIPGRPLLGGNGGVYSEYFGDVGAWRWAVDPPVLFQPGQQIEVNYLPGTTTNTIMLVYEGVYLYAVRGNVKGADASALSLPRYRRALNQNILAPCWMAGEGPETPDGYQDDYFVYSSPSTINATTFAPQGTVLTLPTASATVTIPIEATSDFFLRRLLFDIQADAGVTVATVLGRIRTGTGYAITENMLDLAKYLNGVEFPISLKIRGGDSVSADVSLTNTTGAGNVYFQFHLEGFKRRKL